MDGWMDGGVLFAIVAGRSGRGREGKGGGVGGGRRGCIRSGKGESQRIVGAGQERREWDGGTISL